METLRREEKPEKGNVQNFTHDAIKTVIAFPIKSDGLIYSELLTSIKEGGIRAIIQR
nr:hypothetical protein [uncultured Dyadobacter sp.]